MLPSCRVIPMQEPLPEEHRFSVRPLLHRNDIFNVICGKRTAVLQNADNPCTAVRAGCICALRKTSAPGMNLCAANGADAVDIPSFINNHSVIW